MKLPSLISDRKLIPLLIQYGLCGYIAVFFYSCIREYSYCTVVRNANSIRNHDSFGKK